MDVAVKDAWVTELRSGKYDQGRHSLRTVEGKFCCLGVLCEIAVKQDVIPEPAANGSGDYQYGGTDEVVSRTAVLPKAVMDWSDLVDSLPSVLISVPDEEGYASQTFIDLASLNDSGVPFGQIADIINYFF